MMAVGVVRLTGLCLCMTTRTCSDVTLIMCLLAIPFAILDFGAHIQAHRYNFSALVCSGFAAAVTTSAQQCAGRLSCT